MFLGPLKIKIHKKIINTKNAEEEEKEEEKLVKVDFFSLNEIEVSTILRQIPNYSNHFNPIHSHSFVKLGELGDESESESDFEYTMMNANYNYVLLSRPNKTKSTSFYEIFYKKNTKTDTKTDTNEDVIKIRDNLITTQNMTKKTLNPNKNY